jgi:hypothetical protein
MTGPHVTRASTPFRAVLRWGLRETTCSRCQGKLEIVWIETPEQGPDLRFPNRGIRLEWQSGRRAISVGYECCQCGRVATWNGQPVREGRNAEKTAAEQRAVEGGTG